ncbi:MAG TPA: globin domain-containing protein [Candidatus Limnocylindrales bacterium]|nr:globin domain-containing protein [Candidatus Limnocylindrales bacterium]
MTPQQIALVRSSTDQILRESARVTAVFYRRLFTDSPELRSLFPDDLAQLQQKFADELRFIADTIGDFARFTERIKTLGARHVGYGARARHYQLARRALFAAFTEVLGPQWTPEVDGAWHAAYDIVTELMMLGGAPKPPAPPSIRSHR